MVSECGDRLRLVAYDEIYLRHSAVWLRDPEIRLLTATPEFTDEEQRAFFHSLAGRDDYRIWGVEIDGAPAGAAGIKKINGQRGEYWGYLGIKKLWGQGLGRSMLTGIEREALALGLTHLDLQVIEINERARRLYRANLYDEVGRNNDMVVMTKILG